jgi:signal transduction histidine kinase
MPMSESSTKQPPFAEMTLERRMVELTILYEVSLALQKTLDEQKAIHTILIGVTHGRGLGFNRAFILLVDPKEVWLEGRLAIGPSSAEEASVIWQELRRRHQSLAEILNNTDEFGIRVNRKVNEIVSQFRIPLIKDDDPLIQIMKSRMVALAQDGRFEPHGFEVGSLSNMLEMDSFGVAPLYLGSKDLGVLIADNAITHAVIDPASLRLLQIYAQQASAAIQNTRLYRELMEKVEFCERVNQTLQENQHHLLQVERLSTIGRMAALLAHEIRTPLVSIGGFARKMLRSTHPHDPRKEEMEIIVSEVIRLEKLVDEVLAFGRVSEPEYRPTDINGLIRSILVNMQDEIQKKSVTAELELDSFLPSAQSDEAQLRQALINLVSNSLEAMPSGGILTISTKLDDEYIEIGVRDTGVGIHHKHWDKMFAPFYTTKSTGTGLGLAIVSQVVHNHKGSLRFESIPDQGTVFHIRLALNPKIN